MKEKILVFTGAGISKSAGIPTFEETPNIREKLSLDFFNEHYEEFWNTVKKLQENIVGKKPTLAHELLAEEDYLIITMNIDRLHTLAGSKRTIEVHGNLEKIQCTKCGREYPFNYIYESLTCEECNSNMRPQIALYGDTEISAYNTALQILKLYACKKVMIIGTSYNTGFAYEFYKLAQSLNCTIIEMNENADEQLTDFLVKQSLF